MSRHRVLLVDADIVAFKYASANEEKFFFDGKDQPPAIDADFDAAVAGAKECIAELKDHLKAHEVIICLSDPEANFRKDVYAPYKSKRDYTARPVYLQAIKDWFKLPESGFKTYQRPTLEADDCMGILSTHPTLAKGEKVIVSEDKDMQTIPGLLYNPRKDDQPRTITRLQADRFHLWQTVVGDTTDGYPGAKGVGPKSEEAQAILVSKTVEEMWGHVLAAFRRRKLVPLYPQDAGDAPHIKDAVQQARCARILRATDWDFESKRPRLWTPPSFN